MRRYLLTADRAFVGPGEEPNIIYPAPDPEGAWVRFEDAALARAVIEVLPRCDECERLATFEGRDGSWRIGYKCDEHHKGTWHPLPYAEALRAYLNR